MRYAYINIHGDKKVLGWFDTEAHSCVLPDIAFLHSCTDADWALQETGGEYQLSAQDVLVPYVPTAPELPVVKPSACTHAQGLVALFAIKRITEDDVLEAIASIPDEVQRYTARIGYQRATSWERNSPTMQTMAQLLQLSESDLDELFVYASGVAV